MLKKLFMLCVAVALSLSAGFAAAVEVNTADQAALESVKGIGPVHAKAIVDERAKNGPFKNADDLAARVKGIGQKSVENLEAAGLTINGSSAPPTGAKTSTKPATKTTPAAPAATTAAAPAATTAAPAAAAPASAAKPSKSKKKDKAAASEAAAASAPAVAASAPADASGTKASKKKAKKSKAASAAAASGA
ncbi:MULTISPECIES: ComEA family DNA-binding protein [unclassified Paraburkholderia]|uniref:ComEA family DNA-binding protein n=1 Tax=unclassified Paraburkholderia TaxID=2615204 RepID=UPI00161FBE97|nr:MULTISPECIES: helix-hairpin-helix domain-containing protein [unclassified Paraburkholderia]MBB5412035.1 competence protein ComEA [Paraburkholderia sp. HC6.4b]MBB5454102.1 competence protein ComEA [Paraburkholderia sp. Kb1A]MBC8725563.1 helix-hairpin-helix domain-containing protein [Paraburkholderia sp. 31.1]